jgi:hypothetical protein
MVESKLSDSIDSTANGRFGALRRVQQHNSESDISQRNVVQRNLRRFNKRKSGIFGEF